MATTPKFPPHIAQFFENLEEVTQLIGIHAHLGGTGPGRRRDVEVLNKSAIVLLVACWESYVEDLASLALDFMITNAKDHSVFPKAVLDRVASQNSGANAWTLAGDGWKKALRDNYAGILAKTAGTLNTPRSSQVDELFSKTIGLQSISKCWHWRGRTNEKAIAALDSLITVRGGIAHRVKHSKSVRKRDVMSAAHFINFLAATTSNAVRSHVHSRVGIYPWSRFTYKGAG